MTAQARSRLCVIIPSRNHWHVVPTLVGELRALDLPVFIVDDGSEEPARSALAALHDPASGVAVHRLDKNQGKGAAVRHGFRLALARGFTHGVQLDADGQHDLAAIPSLIAHALAHPDALITGVPIYDQSIPRARAIGRWITHAWVWVETLSLHIQDSMCGFRVYPLNAVASLLESGETIGSRMDFDTEIMVRLVWRGTPVIQVPVRVTYPPGNTSNFRMLGDNCRISLMHTRLVFGMLVRIPRILRNTPLAANQHGTEDRGDRVGAFTLPSHWARLAERGLYGGLRAALAAYRLLGRRGCLGVASLAALYFYCTGKTQRRASADFLRRALPQSNQKGPPKVFDGCRHFFSFAGRCVDTLAAWAGGLGPNAVKVVSPDALHRAMCDGRGALFIVSHHGNMDVARAVLDEATRRRLVVLMHTVHSRNFNRVLEQVNPQAAVNRLEVSEITPDTAIHLRGLIEAGSWIVIAGDRVPLSGQARATRVPFFGEEAPFPIGPYILASLLECPVYLMFCRRARDGYELRVEAFADCIVLPRAGRSAAIREWVTRFAARLEAHAVADPYQWYNFFDFWAPAGKAVERS